DSASHSPDRRIDAAASTLSGDFAAGTVGTFGSPPKGAAGNARPFCGLVRAEHLLSAPLQRAVGAVGRSAGVDGLGGFGANLAAPARRDWNDDAVDDHRVFGAAAARARRVAGTESRCASAASNRQPAAGTIAT